MLARPLRTWASDHLRLIEEAAAAVQLIVDGAGVQGTDIMYMDM